MHTYLVEDEIDAAVHDHMVEHVEERPWHRRPQLLPAEARLRDVDHRHRRPGVREQERSGPDGREQRREQERSAGMEELRVSVGESRSTPQLSVSVCVDARIGSIINETRLRGDGVEHGQVTVGGPGTRAPQAVREVDGRGGEALEQVDALERRPPCVGPLHAP